MDLLAVVAAAHEITMMANSRMTPLLAEHRLTDATAHALWAIDPAEPPPSMKTVADRLFCNASNLTFITNQLVDRGLVTRGTDPADRRSRVLVLTERGRAVRAELIRRMLTVTPFAALGPEELTQLNSLLSRTRETYLRA
ncbi:MarR family winged helix-turn-helix transcriptional regulator [Actinoplanes derwentensis]|uniref:DNA-binding transcriptional regulator, MarR family n=1 Tax=Actinoplanes derwentensis TaxID=113562 RepID=A0A1H2B7Y4_9ACTN|nr:MarR family transcriptional regulator [Actinoplanes derwentensis]GID86444.1 DNA-binding protein [Actinoplanes derwentensis]SDT54331.1 DNA-binding transcriptional regulator, MarR family [Actinoplanes derwentensis]